jgi:putative flippase GtrA
VNPSPERALRDLAARAPKGLFKFLGVGFAGLAVDLSVLWLLEHVGLDKAIARAGSLGLATIVTWALNRRVTFEASGRRAHEELGRYIVVTLVAQGVNYFVFLGLLAVMPGLLHTLAACIGAVCAAGFSYTGHRFFSFARRRRAAAAQADA